MKRQEENELLHLFLIDANYVRKRFLAAYKLAFGRQGVTQLKFSAFEVVSDGLNRSGALMVQQLGLVTTVSEVNHRL